MVRKSMAAQAIALAICLGLTFAAAALGAVASAAAPAFYAQLDQPAWAPPPSVFGPVWSVLYLMMGIAAWLAWRAQAPRRVLALYAGQLAVNALWSWLFFGWHLGAQALADVLLLWALIAATAVAFWRVSRLAGALLLPYLAWVSFATALNAVLWLRNPGLL